jgi:hypothetical protein
MIHLPIKRGPGNPSLESLAVKLEESEDGGDE